MNFPLVLVVLTSATGVIWLIDAYLFRPRRQARYTQKGARKSAEGAADAADPDQPWLAEVSRSFFPILLVVLLLRSFLVEPFQIPSGSMLPTLEVGDFILVNKFTYGLRVPVAHWELLDLGDPKRGDIMVFHYPEEPSVNYIKRVVGLPGDRIAYEGKRLYVNGEPVSSTFVAGLREQELHREQLGRHQFRTLYAQRPTDPKAEGEWTVPEGHYFVMGDNRDNSRDSRYWGMVPDRYVVGKAFAIWMHWESLTSLPTFNRVGWVH
ncbi:signal peptidase I [Halomonadaceae bacterium KBTZ08]